MIKKEIYPKTERIPIEGMKIQITEKLDGSNLAIFKKNDELYIAQRKNIFVLNELEDVKQILYKGLYEWLKNYGQTLQDNLHEGSCICGEWLGMGALKYTIDEFDKRFYMFAKANVNDNFLLYNFIYNHDLFIYPFIDQTIPHFIGVVPLVNETKTIPDKKILDSLYSRYCEKVGHRKVEGFVVNINNYVCKYVRMKSGKLVEYSDKDHKGVENV